MTRNTKIAISIASGVILAYYLEWRERKKVERELLLQGTASSESASEESGDKSMPLGGGGGGGGSYSAPVSTDTSGATVVSNPITSNPVLKPLWIGSAITTGGGSTSGTTSTSSPTTSTGGRVVTGSTPVTTSPTVTTRPRTVATSPYTTVRSGFDGGSNKVEVGSALTDLH